MQNGQPVSYSNRALTVSEKKYSQLEKELLAQVFGNHQLVYGRKIVLWSDHKPLETISKKPLATALKRLQRLLLRLQQYESEIRNKPGPEMYLSDTLSRAYLPTTDRSPAEKEAERMHEIDFQLPTDASESVAQGKVNTSPKSKEIPVPTKPVKSTDLPVTRSRRVSKPPSYLKDLITLK